MEFEWLGSIVQFYSHCHSPKLRSRWVNGAGSTSMDFRTFTQNYRTATFPPTTGERSSTWPQLWLAAILKLRGRPALGYSWPLRAVQGKEKTWLLMMTLLSHRPTILEDCCPVTWAHKSPSFTKPIGGRRFFVISNRQGPTRSNKLHICLYNMPQFHLKYYKNNTYKHIYRHLLVSEE